jgi:hypothetical protein
MTRNCLLLASGVLALVCSPASATVITVNSLGSVSNASVSLPSTHTPGSSQTFADYFEFTLPVGEYVSASVSISGPTVDQIPANQGDLILANWTTTGSTSPFIPAGAIIQQAVISSPGPGGQSAEVGTQTPLGTFEPAGKYFIEIIGPSGVGQLHVALDGNVTAVVGAAIPELSTWAMFGLGLAGLGLLGLAKRGRERQRFAF